MAGGGLVLWKCAALLAVASAGPLGRFSRETDDYQNIDLSAYANYTANEVCFSDNEVFQKGDLMPNPGPCEECRCEPPSIVCNMVKCPVNNNGCRTIQQPNHCCPDYNCECDYNGQLYNDGERLELPEEPCQVCYCKGGEVMCTSITCYQRDDCEPLQVPGQCCPKYENCPLRDMEASNTDDKNVRTRSPNNSPKREMQPWLLTKSALHTSSLPKHTDVPDDPTTEDVNIIIVSDWLTERRTTTEDGTGEGSRQEGFGHTSGPTYSTEMTSVQQQNVNAGGNVVRKTETITPLDEVIFTRIDMLRGHQGSPSTDMPSDIVKETVITATPSAPDDTDTTYTETSISELEVTETTPYPTPNEKLISQVKNTNVDTSEEKNSLPSSEDLEEQSGRTTSPTEATATDTNAVDNNDESKMENDKEEYKSDPETSTPTLSENTNTVLIDTTEMNAIKQEVHQSLFEKSDEPNTTPDTETSLDAGSEQKVESSEEITLEHLFGLDRSEVKDFKELDVTENDITTNEPTTVKNINNKFGAGFAENLRIDIQSTTMDQEVTETTESYSTRNTVMGDSPKDNSKTEVTIIESNESEYHSETSGLEETSTLTSKEVETTTPYFTEDHMNWLMKDFGIFFNSEEDLTNNEESTTESIKSTMTAVARSDDDESSGKLVEPNKTIFETGKLNVDTTTFDYTEITVPTTTEFVDVLDSQKTEHLIESVSEEKNKYDIQEVHPNTNVTNTSSVISAVLGQENKTSPHRVETKYSIEETGSQDILQSIEDSNYSSEDNVFDKNEYANDRKEIISDVPPVLELNSHVAFLQFGGHDGSDSSFDVTDEDHQTTIPSEQETFPENQTEQHTNELLSNPNTNILENLSNDSASKILVSTTDGTEIYSRTEIHPNETKDEKTSTESFIGSIPTTSHIPLTPNDLKVLAEYLINGKIKPVTPVNDSVYTPNQWLKGNLTSKENIASILSAANVTIGIMNQTDLGTKLVSPETSTRANEVIRIDKFEKESLFKGNSILNSGNAIVNKTGYLHNKYNDNQDFPKNHLKSQTAPIEGIGTDVEMTTVSTDKVSTSTHTSTEARTEPVLETSQHLSGVNGTSVELLKDTLHKYNSNEKYDEHPSTSRTVESSTTQTNNSTKSTLIDEATPLKMLQSSNEDIDDKEKISSEVEKTISQEDSTKTDSESVDLTPTVFTIPKETSQKQTVIP